jgi:hypothetical protein
VNLGVRRVIGYTEGRTPRGRFVVKIDARKHGPLGEYDLFTVPLCLGSFWPRFRARSPLGLAASVKACASKVPPTGAAPVAPFPGRAADQRDGPDARSRAAVAASMGRSRTLTQVLRPRSRGAHAPFRHCDDLKPRVHRPFGRPAARNVANKLGLPDRRDTYVTWVCQLGDGSREKAYGSDRGCAERLPIVQP